MRRTLIILNGRWIRPTPGKPDPVHDEPLEEPAITVCVDLDNRLWVARRNWQLARESFFGCVTGTAEDKYGELLLHCKGPDPVQLLDYSTNGHPKRDGRAVKGHHPIYKDFYEFKSRWWRYDDPSIMTPVDRMAEILDRAIRSPTLETKLKEQLGALADPRILLPIAGVFAAMFGAEFVGGAVAVFCLARALGVAQFLCDYHFYNPRFQQINHIVWNAQRPEQLDEAAELTAEVLAQLIGDLAACLGITAIGTLVTKLFSTLVAYTPETFREHIRTNAAVAEAYIRGKGYARRDLLRSADDSPVEIAAIKTYEDMAVRNREVIAVREPNMARLQWILSHVWNRAKPAWLKAKSKDGWNGLVCLSKQPGLADLGPRVGSYDMGNLRGVTAEIDAQLAQLPRQAPMYRLPTDGREIKGIDYAFAGKDRVLLKDHYLVDMGDRFLLIEKPGHPYIADLDVITRQRPGTAQAGDHLPRQGKNKTFPEDDMIIEWEINRQYNAHGGSPLHDPMQHGGKGASVVHVRESKAKNKPHWSPRESDGSFAKERILIVLPEASNHKIVGRTYILDNWSDFQTFCKANNLEFPF